MMVSLISYLQCGEKRMYWIDEDFAFIFVHSVHYSIMNLITRTRISAVFV